MLALPFKLNQDRRHHIPRQRHKVTNWPAYNASLRQRGSLTVWFTDEAVAGLSQDWGSGGDCHWRAWIVGWLELLSEAGTERAIIDGAPNLQQQVGAAPRPAHPL